MPMYSNAMLLSAEDNQTNYLDGHALTYKCNSNFASNAGSLQCTCNTTTAPYQWICSPEDLASTCRRSKPLTNRKNEVDRGRSVRALVAACKIQIPT